MPKDRFLIGYNDPNSSLQTNLKPFAIPDNAFANLQNAFVYRGRVRKRFGVRYVNPNTAASVAQLTSRLRHVLVPAALVVTTPINVAVGQAFSIGTDIFTVVNAAVGQFLLTTSAVTAQVTAVNQVTFSAIATTVYWYPALPVMGIATYEQSTTNAEEIIAFDTKYAYRFTGGGFAGALTGWTPAKGNNSQFFWWTNWRGTTDNSRLLFVTNYNSADGIRYWDGTTWATLNPNVDTSGSPVSITSARIIVPFKGRLILLNTIESNSANAYVNRCRYSQVGNPLDANAWIQAPFLYGRGGFIDAPTREAIITAEFVKDRLIVYFERSTWELVYTDNQQLPFVWQQINTELGAESTFSVVPFDKVALGVGHTGIHASTGTNVDRIDDKIPDTVFDIKNSENGPDRVYGIRDYFAEVVYWTYPDGSRNSTAPWPNKILVFNYKTGSWAQYDDSITAFGYYQPLTEGVSVSWDSTTVTWDSTDENWGSGALQSRFRSVIGGNQQGYMFVCDSGTAQQAGVLQVTNVVSATATVTAIDHNLIDGDIIRFTNMSGLTLVNDGIYQVGVVSDKDTFTVVNISTKNPGVPFTGTYTGGGTIARVPKIDIYTKQFNFYANNGANVAVNQVDMQFDRTDSGAITVDYATSSNENGYLQTAVSTGVAQGNGEISTAPYALYPYEETAARVWRTNYPQAVGEYVQLNLYTSDSQMVDLGVINDDFQLHQMIISAQPAGRLQ